MGYGDAIMATGTMRDFHAQGKLAAFFSPDGDHRKIKWTGYCDDVLRNNPNVARPGQEQQDNLIWMPHYKKVFTYARHEAGRWVWDRSFRPTPGEFFFSADERLIDKEAVKPFVFIEPNVAWQRAANVNKDWGAGKYEQLAKALIERGHTVVQCIHANSRRKIPGAHHVSTKLFRTAARVMSHARLIIAPEGANHHAAAALGVPSVIVWGDWSPETMGYAGQIKLTGKEKPRACGHTFNCAHCRQTMDSITVEEVYQAALGRLH